MDSEIVAIYVVCDDVLRMLEVRDDPPTVMSRAEVMALSVIAAKFFGGNHKQAQWYCLQLGYFPNILSPSRLNRCLHKIPWGVWMALFQYLSLVFKKRSKDPDCYLICSGRLRGSGWWFGRCDEANSLCTIREEKRINPAPLRRGMADKGGDNLGLRQTKPLIMPASPTTL